ncbi:uncharacterized protein LOC113372894 [Ctenocephalides felis]|uniref:uncharacterized protein LOC113372894 n=1 Tax=Ctenocephalides felis TaxID=7515 RepID=UPI000E6E19A7|nr:uncharacterized protein LOC113372894 [Ctenocephalides felis]
MQYTGSFKERGASYAISQLTDCQKKIGIVAASAGNHAQAVSYHGLKVEMPVAVVMPTIAPVMKIQKCKNLKAEVFVQGKDMGEAKRIAQEMSMEKGYAYVNGFDHPHIIAGQGSIAIEIMEQMKEVDAIVVPVGGGSIIAGVCAYMSKANPKCKIIGVESEKCPGMTEAIKMGKPSPVESFPSLADGLAVPVVGYNSFATASPHIYKMIVIREEYISLAMMRLVELEKTVVEGAGASALAAILTGELDEFRCKKVCCVLTGGNVDTTFLGRALERGLASDGRLLKFKVTIADKPGALADLCAKVSATGVSMKKILQEKTWVNADMFQVQIKMIVETLGVDHSKELRDVLVKDYKNVFFNDSPVAVTSEMSLPGLAIGQASKKPFDCNDPNNNQGQGQGGGSANERETVLGHISNVCDCSNK